MLFSLILVLFHMFGLMEMISGRDIPTQPRFLSCSSTVRVTWGGFEELFRQTSPEAGPLSRAVEDRYSALLRASNSLQNKWRFRGESVSKAEGAEEKMNEILSAESNYLHVFVLGDSAPTCSIVWSLHGFLQQ